MKKISLLQFASLSLIALNLSAQSTPIGLWKTIDDATGEAKSYVEISESNGVLSGHVAQLLLKPADSICDKCKGDNKDKPVVGMKILEGLKKDGNVYTGGTIMDPENGKTYNCKISPESADKLKVRGYIGIEALGRSQFWYRVQ